MVCVCVGDVCVCVGDVCVCVLVMCVCVGDVCVGDVCPGANLIIMVMLAIHSFQHYTVRTHVFHLSRSPICKGLTVYIRNNFSSHFRKSVNILSI